MRGITYDQVFADDPFSPHLAEGDVRAMSYFSIGSLGSAVKSIGTIGLEAVGAASSIYGAYRGLTGHTSTGAANVGAAGGPTATSTALSHPVLETAQQAQHPVMTAIENVLDPFRKKGVARYAPAGTKGYHPIKRGPHAGLWTRNRHRNPCNIHALRRAISRAHSFEKIARKVIHFTHPRKTWAAAHFKMRKRSR